MSRTWFFNSRMTMNGDWYVPTFKVLPNIVLKY